MPCLAHVQVVGALMHEIECILHEYLSFNWDRVEDIYDANSVYLAEDGLKCQWHSNHHLSVGTHSLTRLAPLVTSLRQS